jgi:hypothetical protein
MYVTIVTNKYEGISYSLKLVIEKRSIYEIEPKKKWQLLELNQRPRTSFPPDLLLIVSFAYILVHFRRRVY